MKKSRISKTGFHSLESIQNSWSTIWRCSMQLSPLLMDDWMFKQVQYHLVDPWRAEAHDWILQNLFCLEGGGYLRGHKADIESGLGLFNDICDILYHSGRSGWDPPPFSPYILTSLVSSFVTPIAPFCQTPPRIETPWGLYALHNQIDRRDYWCPVCKPGRKGKLCLPGEQ